MASSGSVLLIKEGSKEKETVRRISVDVVSYKDGPSPPNSVSPRSAERLEGAEDSESHDKMAELSNSSGNLPSTSDKRSNLKRTKSQDALGRLSRVFKFNES